ncbi:hypothetical protein FO440_05300 [Mucilaginibacter corticis]|uniref:Peptidyl-prolyl cis-trans isomerase n=2 Tax=Mucilaginibacter corticis TaxID=2597670 RepID=A0A556MUY2_9SPHI|nr:hypothetical protein FO440_05300 [Mucilaginibacter corticis]
MKVIQMKKYFLLICLVTVAFSSCRKVVQSPFSDTQQAIADDNAIQDYFLSNGITNATKDPSGVYYIITNPGTGPHPTINSNVTVGYSIYLFDTSFVESQSSRYFAPLSSYIKGWQVGIPLIGTGGSITLYVPSGLAFGTSGTTNIEANTPLIFNITLQGFNN